MSEHDFDLLGSPFRLHPPGMWLDPGKQPPPEDELILVRYHAAGDWAYGLGCHQGEFDPRAFPVDGGRHRISHWLRLPALPLTPRQSGLPESGERYGINNDLDQEEVWEIVDCGRHLDPLGARTLIDARNLRTDKEIQMRVKAWRALAPTKLG